MTDIDKMFRLAESNHGLDLDDGLREHLVFGFTGYPAFWPIPREGKSPGECLWRQYNRVVRRVAKGLPIEGQMAFAPCYPGRHERRP